MRNQKKIDILEYDNHDFYNKYTFVLDNATDCAVNTVNIFSNLLSSIFSIFFLLALMLTINKLIVLISIISAIINFFINLKVAELNYGLSKTIIPDSRKKGYVRRMYYLKEYSKDFRTTNVSKALSKLYRNGKDNIIEAIKEMGKNIVILNIIQGVLQIIIMLVVIIYLSNSLIKATMSPGDFAAVFNSFGQLSASIQGMMSFFPELYNNSLYITDFKKFLEFKTENDYDKINIYDFEEMEFRNVFFSHNKQENVLENISMKLKKGEKIALVGLNGAGKSTIANMMQGLYEPKQGDVLLNKKPIRYYKRQNLNKIIGSLPQDFKIYAISILENIIMDSEDKEEKIYTNKISMVLKNLNIYNKIEKLYNQLNTKISYELDFDGANFSGGELQKIALSRVLYFDYKLIILDEPSSALDSYSEKEIFDSLLNKYSKESIVFISHKLANIINVDKIYFLENGVIKEQGSHKELIDLGGAYSELFKLQAEKYTI